MITIEFTYFSKKEKCYKDGEKTFYDAKKALSFMFYLSNHGCLIKSYSCENSDDKEYIDKRFNFNMNYAGWIPSKRGGGNDK